MPNRHLPLGTDVPSPLPTTRDIARAFKEAGVEGLPNSVRRADHATYQEVQCRSALNRVEGMPFAWTLNPYRGCTHGCHYCFARRYQGQLEMGAGDDFSSVILVKVNFPEILRRELAGGLASRNLVALGSATDPYQPAEGYYRVTRQSLQVFMDYPTPISIVTKGPLVVRDIDLLVELSKRTSCSVCISVPTVDETAWRRLEPGTAHPNQRLRAVKRLADAGLRAGVLMAPIVPGISSHPEKLNRTVKAISEHGAVFVGASLLHLEGSARAHFLDFLSCEYPDLVEGYGRLYAGKYASKSYAARVHSILATLKKDHGIVTSRRPEEKRPVQKRVRIQPVARQRALRLQ